MTAGGLELVCHVIVVETPQGLLLVDTGFGTLDVLNPRARLGMSRIFVRPRLDMRETAISQLLAMDFDPNDVRHIVVTHFDLDHIGGLADFPQATVHTCRAEVLGATLTPSSRERLRYRSTQWSHSPPIVQHEIEGEQWHGFPAAKQLNDIDPGVVLIALPGHSRGHIAVAIDAGHQWVLHAGDAIYHHHQLTGDRQAPSILRSFEALVAHDRKLLVDNHNRLAELHRERRNDIAIVCSHDHTLFEQARRASNLSY